MTLLEAEGLSEEVARRRRGGRGTEHRITSKAAGAHDFFVTPAWVTEALLDREVFAGPIWEPACGNGAMSRVLEAAGYAVHSTDLVDRGYGEGGVDFLAQPFPVAVHPGSIVTNPPFSLAGDFARHALGLGVRKVALFGRLGFLEGQKRAAFFERHPPSRVWIFARRATLWAGDAPDPKERGGRQAFAWFVWERGHPPAAPGWIR